MDDLKRPHPRSRTDHRTTWRQCVAARVTGWSVVGGSLGLALLGCTPYNSAHRTLVSELAAYPRVTEAKLSCMIYCQWAHDAWHQTAGLARQPLSGEFKNGFLRGFVDFVYAGGNGEPPAVPPPRFRKNAHRTAEGNSLLADWNAGFRYGARVARDGGYRRRAIKPASDASGFPHEGSEGLPPELEEAMSSDALPSDVETPFWEPDVEMLDAPPASSAAAGEPTPAELPPSVNPTVDQSEDVAPAPAPNDARVEPDNATNKSSESPSTPSNGRSVEELPSGDSGESEESPSEVNNIDPGDGSLESVPVEPTPAAPPSEGEAAPEEQRLEELENSPTTESDDQLVPGPNEDNPSADPFQDNDGNSPNGSNDSLLNPNEPSAEIDLLLPDSVHHRAPSVRGDADAAFWQETGIEQGLQEFLQNGQIQPVQAILPLRRSGSPDRSTETDGGPPPAPRAPWVSASSSRKSPAGVQLSPSTTTGFQAVNTPTPAGWQARTQQRQSP